MDIKRVWLVRHGVVVLIRTVLYNIVIRASCCYRRANDGRLVVGVAITRDCRRGTVGEVRVGQSQVAESLRKVAVVAIHGVAADGRLSGVGAGHTRGASTT